MKAAVTLLSGGLDSVTLAYHLAQEYEIHALSFDYGQRHRKELIVAEGIARNAGFRWHSVRILTWDGNTQHTLASLLPGSALTDTRVDVPHGHYEDESMKATVVPNRNAIMLSIAYGVAVAIRADLVAFAAHAGDHAIYPDCRPEFVNALDLALRRGNAWDNTTHVPAITAPFLSKSKADIAILAHELDVPIADTWSCYEGGVEQCGLCGTCVERREALELARLATGKPDPTTYRAVRA